MLSAARAALHSRLQPGWIAIPTRSYRPSIPSYHPYTKKSRLLYRRNGTPRSRLIGALNISCVFILALISHAKSDSEIRAGFLCRLVYHEVETRKYDFSTIDDLLDFFFMHIAQNRGDARERTLDMLKASPDSRERLRKHLEEYCDISRNSKEDPVKNALALYIKVKEIISEMDLRLFGLPSFEAERLFRESPGGKDRYRESRGGNKHEEVG